MKRLIAPVLSIALLLNATPMAEAHSSLISSHPKSGAVLKAVPELVTLTFNEKILVIPGSHPNSLNISSTSGESLAKGALKVSGNKVSISLKSKKLTGTLKVAYRVVSADGHVISGQYLFTVK